MSVQEFHSNICVKNASGITSCLSEVTIFLIVVDVTIITSILLPYEPTCDDTKIVKLCTLDLTVTLSHVKDRSSGYRLPK